MSNKKTKQHTVRFKEDNQHLEQMKILWQKVKRASKENKDTTALSIHSLTSLLLFLSLTFGAAEDPRGEDVSASQYGAATLSAHHHL